MSKILVISTSLRPFSNSEALADEFVIGAQEAGHEVIKISLRGKQIAFCRGCMACNTRGHCSIQDDAIGIANAMFEADVICFATPIYYYEMSGQMKTLLDRCNALYHSDYHFRDIYLLTAAAEEEESVPERAIAGLGGWLACYPKTRLAGTVFAGGVYAMSDIEGHPALQQAHEMGRKA